MNPWLLVVAVVVSVAAFFYGQRVGEQGAEAQKARDERIAKVAYDAGQDGAAAAIAKLKPRNVTIRQELEREIREKTVYLDCRVPASGVQLLNDAIVGGPEPAGDRELPPAGAAAASP